MFMAVSNFAAAPTGASLITKFFKQPSHTAPPQQQQPTSAHQEQLPHGQGHPANALDCGGEQATVLMGHPAGECEVAERGKAGPVVVEPFKTEEVTEPAGEQQQPKGKSPVMAGLTEADTSELPLGLQEDALDKRPFRAARHLSAVGSDSSAGQNPAIALTHKEPSALLETDAGGAMPEGCSLQGGDLLQLCSSCPPPAMPSADQDSHQRGTTQDNKAATAASRQDSSGASDHLGQAQAAQSDSFENSIPGQGSVRQAPTKRPLAQATTKEPEHRKKPTRSATTLSFDVCLDKLPTQVELEGCMEPQCHNTVLATKVPIARYWQTCPISISAAL